MARARGGGDQSARPRRRRSKLRRQIDAILADIPSHRETLDAAMAEFGTDFDLAAYTEAWGSPDPDVRKRTATVERELEVLQNYLHGLAQIGLAEARGLGAIPGNLAGTPFEQLHELGVVSEQSARLLSGLQDLRNRTQHFYPAVPPEEVHQGVRELRGEITGFTDRYKRWLDGLDRAG